MLFNIIKKAIKACLPYGIVIGVPRLQNYIKKMTPRRKLEFEIHLADHCNLACKGCTHFSPLAKEKFLDTEIFERDMIRLAELTHKDIKRISLLGGEPLLHPKIIDVCNIARKYSTGRIEIITNGVLLSSQPKEFWQCCKDNNIGVIISSYPVRLDRQGITGAAGKYGVTLTWRGGNTGGGGTFVVGARLY